MDYLKRAVELAQTSFEAGEFPAGAVLVSKNGGVYESKPSVPHNHGETMVIDMAIEAEGAPLIGATIYASMQPCLMCSSKMYWAGIENVHYAIPKSDVRADYAYENDSDTAAIVSKFFKPLNMTQHPELMGEALATYKEWVRKIESHGG
jgi:tRNA(Arg) A34 adenosine deaminase TadA